MHAITTLILSLLCSTMSAATIPSLTDASPTWIHGTNPCDGREALTVVGSIASWCPYSGKYITPYEDLHKLVGTTVAIGLVSKESRDDIDLFVEEHLQDSPIPIAQVSDEWYEQLTTDVTTVPHTFILNSANEIIWRGHPNRLLDTFIRDDDGRINVRGTKAYLIAKYRSAEAVDQYGDAGPDDRPRMLKNILRYNKTMLRIQPGDRDALQTLSRCHEINGDRTDMADFLKAIDTQTLTAAEANSIAWAMVTNSTPSWQFPREALRLSLYSLEREPNNGAFLDTLARIHYLLGNLPRALEMQRQAVVASPDSESIATTLAYYQSLITPGSDGCSLP